MESSLVLLEEAVCYDQCMFVFALLHFVLQGQICLLLQVFLDFLHLTLSNGTPLQYSYLENPMDGGAW